MHQKVCVCVWGEGADAENQWCCTCLKPASQQTVPGAGDQITGAKQPSLGWSLKSLKAQREKLQSGAMVNTLLGKGQFTFMRRCCRLYRVHVMPHIYKHTHVGACTQTPLEPSSLSSKLSHFSEHKQGQSIYFSLTFVIRQ